MLKNQITKERVLGELKKVIDPELDVNIVDLGLIYNIKIDDIRGKVTIEMTLTTPGCPLAMVFDEWVKGAVEKVEGVKTVIINLVWEPAWNPDKMTEEAREKAGLL